MKRIMTTVIITAVLSLFAVLAPGSAADVELDKRHVKLVEIRPVTPRNGKNVALSITVTPPVGVKLPREISASVNEKQVDFHDDGRWPDERAGDGVYSIAAATKSGEPLNEKTTLRVKSNSHHAAAPNISCTLKVVECPSSCKSVVTGSKCVICFKIESCEISLLN